MATEAWRDLDCVARCAYVELSLRYYGDADDARWSTNGRIAMSVRDLADRLNVSPATAARALRSLIEHGFVVVTTPGGFTRKERHATEYRLTEHPCGVTGALPTKDFARWRKNTVHVVTPTVSVVTPIGARGDTVDPDAPTENGRHGVTSDTDTAAVGTCGDTHIYLPVGGGIAAANQLSAAVANSDTDIARRASRARLA